MFKSVSYTETALELRAALSTEHSAHDAAVQLARLAMNIATIPRVADIDSDARALLWKSCLGIVSVDGDFYLRLLREGPSRADKKIRDDTFRTFMHDKDFWSRVEEGSLIRVLNAVERWTGHDVCMHCGKEASDDTARPAYVQGMNVLLGVFLYVMPELDAFYCFKTFITTRCPSYVTPTLKGAHQACRLVGKLLAVFDKELSVHLHGKVDPTIFAFAPCLSFLASLKPLGQVIKLWNLILSLGPHFSIIFYVTHLTLNRDVLLAENSPYRIQKIIGGRAIDGDIIISSFKRYLNLISDDLYAEIVNHPFEGAGKSMDKEGIVRARSVNSSANAVKPGNKIIIRSKSASKSRTDKVTRHSSQKEA